MRGWESLRSPADFDAVRKGGVRHSDRHVTVWITQKEGSSRAGFSVPVRSLGHIRRNLVRRRLRAVFDEVVPSTGIDMVVSVRCDAPPPYSVLRDAVARALKEAGDVAGGTAGVVR